jgi:hypothetical protein
MRKLSAAIIGAVLFCGCVGMATTDGDSTKEWIKVESSKTDLNGSVKDVCYRLDLKFSPAFAAYVFDTDLACITKCCWYNERKTVDIDLNAGFAGRMEETGRAVKYNPEKLTVHLTYSSFLNTIHGRMKPKGVLKSGGLVQLEASELKDPEHYLTVGYEGFKAKEYNPEEGASNKAAYLFAAQDPQASAKAAAAKAAEEAAVAEVNPQSEREREDLLQKRLSYERGEAVKLLKRFYNKEIDAYILSVDKAEKKKGNVLLTNDRSWAAVKIGSPVYRIACNVKGRLGKTKQSMKPYPLPCGVYEVDLDEQTVAARDSLGRSIVSGEYKN